MYHIYSILYLTGKKKKKKAIEDKQKQDKIKFILSMVFPKICSGSI